MIILLMSEKNTAAMERHVSVEFRERLADEPLASAGGADTAFAIDANGLGREVCEVDGVWLIEPGVFADIHQRIVRAGGA